MKKEIHIAEWLFTADAQELAAPPPEIERHIAECLTCRAALRDVRNGYEQLDRGLSSIAQPRRRRAWWIPLTTAAAAIIAGVMMLTPREYTPKPPTMLAQLMFPPQSVVQTQNGEQAVVMERDGVTVIWLTNTQGQQ